ncbi:Endonuclease/exonuclease/phosphatase [Lipomyces arxii]|uniref:Endonuclease/exonuclease/phosphatase n=1 Tax=Lipomyces arxii TaxID=56418 RepID=UPI0034CDDE88
MDSVTLFCFTFNCAQVIHSPKTIQKGLKKALNGTLYPDIVFLSLQEVGPIYDVFWGLGQSYVDPFIDAVVNLTTSNYSLVSQCSAGLTFGLLFQRKNSQVSISDVQTSSVTFGYFETGLKGAASVRIKVSDETTKLGPVELTFVAAHLAANEGYKHLRDHNFRDIARKLAFFNDTKHKSRSFLYKDNAHVFILGDLNYRTALPRQTFVQGIAAPDTTPPKWSQPSSSYVDDWFQYDELTKSRQQADAFIGFTEPTLGFAPTYKFTDSRDYSRRRIPSWCDRIMYIDAFVSNSDQKVPPILVSEYTSLPDVAGSDHIPVYALITVPLAQPGILAPEIVQKLSSKDIAVSSESIPIVASLRGVDRADRNGLPAVIARQIKLQDRHIVARNSRIKNTEKLIGVVVYLLQTTIGNEILIGFGAGLISVTIYWMFRSNES